MTVSRVLAKINVGAWLFGGAVVLAWYLLVAMKVLDYDYLPGPDEVVRALVDLARSGELWTAIGHTLGVTVAAGGAAIAIGLVWGVAMGLIPALGTYTLGSIDVLRTLPVVALMPVALLIWGPAGKTEFFLAAYAGLWPMLVNTAGGASTIHPRLHEVAATLRLSRVDTVRKIVVPAAAPVMLVGARLAIVTALVIAITAEMFVNPRGLGWGVAEMQQALRPDAMWAYAFVCGLLGYLLNLVLIQAIRLALPGSRAASSPTAGA